MKQLNVNPYILIPLVVFACIGMVWTFNKLKANFYNPTCVEYRNRILDKIIPLDTADEMYNAFGDNEIAILRKTMERDSTESTERVLTQNEKGRISKEAEFAFGDHTRYGFYTYQKLKDYMSYLECINEDMTANNKPGIKSIRFYFSRYPEGYYPEGDLRESYNNRNSLFILPTTGVGDEEYGFFIKDASTDPKYVSIRDNISGPADHSLIMNEIGLTPPPRNGLQDFQ